MKKKANSSYNGRAFASDCNKIKVSTLLEAPSITIMPIMITDAYKKGKTLRNSMFMKGGLA